MKPMPAKIKPKKPENSLDFLGSTWVPYVVRNMSFWHMYANFPGYHKHFPDFGIAKGLDVVSITLDGVSTHVFVRDPNFSEVGTLIKNTWLLPRGTAKFKAFFKRYSQELLVALGKCKQELTEETWKKFVISYERFTVALNITAVFGRIGMTSLTDKLLKLGFAENEIPNVIATATYPEEHTPLFLSQLDLYKLAVSSKEKRWDEKRRTKALLLWLKKYQHIPVNFCDEPWTVTDARSQLAQIEKVSPTEGLKRLKADHKKHVREAEAMRKKIGNTSASRLAEAIGQATILNEFRKNVFCRVWLEVRPIFKRAAERGGSSNWRDGFYVHPDEMTELLFGNTFSLEELIKKRPIIAHYVIQGEIKVLPEEATVRFLEHINSLSGKASSGFEVSEEVKEIKGYSASRGKVAGIVKVLFGSKDFSKMNTGDILVAPATSVDFVPVMEKAAAFVTNEGGITSHASIVSREMGKPCIIGTKIATKVLRDGDLVEVDAENGIVRIIKKA